MENFLNGARPRTKLKYLKKRRGAAPTELSVGGAIAAVASLKTILIKDGALLSGMRSIG